MAIRKDEIGFDNYILYQKDDGFCYGVDAVILADFAKCGPADKVMDLGTGTGIVPLIIYSKYKPAIIFGIEKQQESYQLGCRNIEENGLAGVLFFDNCDVLDVKSRYDAESFSVVTCNPPYMEKGRGPESPNTVQHIARTETTASLDDFIESAAYLLQNGGHLYMVHRPSRLPDIFESCRKHGLEPKQLRLVVPHAGEAANIALIDCVKGAGRELKILPELPVRTKDGFSDEINNIYNR